MGLKMEWQTHEGQDLCCPIIVCDACGRQITDVTMGVYLWEEVPTNEGHYGVTIANDGKLYFAHKRECHHAIETRLKHGLSPVPWMELDVLPGYISANIGLKQSNK